MPEALDESSMVLKVEKAVERILAGPSFRGSNQCQALLRYIVEHSIAHDEQMLRERMIGANVFGRSLDYDTGNDPIVRARAAEVRKRLAQHYQRLEGAVEEIRIEIPTGGYRAVFKTPDKPDVRGAPPGISNLAESTNGSVTVREETSTARVDEHSLFREVPAVVSVNDSGSMQRIRPSRKGWFLAVALIAIVLTTLTLLTIRDVRMRDSRLYDSFWKPVLKAERPVVVFIGANHTYDLTKGFIAQYRAQNHMEGDEGQEFFIDLHPGVKLDEKDLTTDNGLIGFGDVAAAARIASMLTKFNKSYELRYGDDMTVSDLRSSAGILIGGFSNRWTLRVMRQLPFRLKGGDRIVDSGDESRVWVRKSSPDSLEGDDYAVISRVMKSETGSFVLVIAGIDTYSNQAAADFLNDPNRLNPVLRTLPAGWENRDIQIVLHTTVVQRVPAVVNVEAVKVW